MQDDKVDMQQPPAAEAEDARDTDLVQQLEAARERIDATEAELAQIRDSQLRERADLENQRRRMARELEQARRFANEKLLRELLPVCDSLERGLSIEHDGADALREGMQLTLKALLKVMEDNGLDRIDPLGQPFDPERHEAMSMIEPGQGQAPNSVVTVLEKGYLLNGRLLRPARVIVAREQ